MKESREQIARHLNSYKADDVKLFYDLCSAVLLRNSDFDAAFSAGEEDIRPIIEEETDKKIPFDYENIISQADLETFREFEELEDKKRINKAKRIELLSALLDSDTLFEGFCVVFFESDEMLQKLCEDLGCTQRYQELAEDPVYQKRRAYVQLISMYAYAAVHLYGCIHIGEFLLLLLRYEPSISGPEGYMRSSGTYRNTLFFSPEYVCAFTIEQLIGNGVPDVCVNMQGFIMDIDFADDVKRQNEKFLDYAKKFKRPLTERDLDRFSEDTWDDFSFHILYDIAAEKEMYLPPSKSEFLKYADASYREVSAAEEELRKFLYKKYKRDPEAFAKTPNPSIEEDIDMILEDIHDIAADHAYEFEMDPQEKIEMAIAMIGDMGVEFSGMDEINTFLKCVVRIINETRLWTNHGFTPNELGAKRLAGPADTTIVPGSSKAAALLRENQAEIERMGFTIDPDYGAVEIPTFTFPDGPSGEMKTKKKKIYPNDPCPCGSGKKYKKCCGR